MMRRLRPVAALAMVTLIGAGCSDGPADNGPEGAGTHATSRSKAVLFAECMREEGVGGFPDPNVAGDQEVVEAIQRLDTSSAAFEQAVRACKHLQPAGLLGGRATTEEMQQRLAFARCMRDNGVEDFPDPTRDGPLVDTRRIPSAAGRGAQAIPGFQAAMDACRGAAADALGAE